MNNSLEKIETFKKIIRLSGVFLLLLTIVAIKCGWFYDQPTNSTDITFAFVTVPLGLMCVFPINIVEGVEGDYDEE